MHPATAITGYDCVQIFSQSMMTRLANCTASSFLNKRFSEKYPGGNWREGKVKAFNRARLGHSEGRQARILHRAINPPDTCEHGQASRL